MRLLLLDTDLSLRWKDEHTKARTRGFPLCQSGGCLILASVLAAERAADQGNDCWRAAFDRPVRNALWVKAETLVAALFCWLKVQRTGWSEVRDQGGHEGIFHLQTRWEWSGSHQQMGAGGWLRQRNQRG